MKNILFMIADDLGRDTGYLGNATVRTPHLDGFAAQGVSFDQAFCTAATCSASRATMFTGMHNHEIGHYGHYHGYHHFSTLDGVETAPGLLREAGYLCAIVGKIHVGPDHVYPWEIRREGFRGNRDVRAMGRAAGEVFDSDRPFFVTLGFSDTHRDGTRKGFANTDYPGVQRRSFDQGDVLVPSFLPDIPEVREELAEYYESMHRLDQGVGMVLAELDRSGHTHDTLVVFVSDNGIPFVNSKTTLYEAGLHLPMFVRAPDGHGGWMGSGVRSPNMVSYIDLLPTFLDWADIEPGESKRRGKSVLGILDTTEPLETWSVVHGSHTFHEVTNYYPTRVLRTRRYKYHRNIAWKLDFSFASDLYASLSWEGITRAGTGMIGQRSMEQYIRRPPEELYDLENDPDEIRNLAKDPAHRKTLEQMRSALEAWQRETNDPWLFRDGVSLPAVERYASEGLEIPDRWDMEW